MDKNKEWYEIHIDLRYAEDSRILEVISILHEQGIVHELVRCSK